MMSYYIGFGAIGGAVLLFGLSRTWLRARTWRSSLEQLANKHGLTHVQPEGAASRIYDFVHGASRGFDIRVNVEDLAPAGSEHTRLAVRVEVSGVVEAHVCLEADDGRKATGWNAGDARSELDSELAAALVRGLRVDHGAFVWTSRKFPRYPDELDKQLLWLLDLAQRLHVPE